MVHRHDDPVEVRTRTATGPTGDPRVTGPVPAAFLWRGRLYLVREVLGQWYERGGSRSEDTAGTAARAPVDRAPVDRAQVDRAQVDRAQVFRVQAAAGRSDPTGVYDLSRATTNWRLLRASD